MLVRQFPQQLQEVEAGHESGHRASVVGITASLIRRKKKKEGQESKKNKRLLHNRNRMKKKIEDEEGRERRI